MVMSSPKEAIISSLTWIHSCSIIQKAKHKSSSKILSPFCKQSSFHYWVINHKITPNKSMIRR